MTDWITITPRDLYHPVGQQPGDPATGYLRHWTPILGPTATLLYHHLHHATANGPVDVRLTTLAATLGLGKGTARNSLLGRGISRLGYFGLLCPEIGTDGARLYLATTLPPADRNRGHHPDRRQVHQIDAG